MYIHLHGFPHSGDYNYKIIIACLFIQLNNWLKAFGIISQSYFCTLLLVELYLQLRHSSFIHRYTTCYFTRVKILIVFIGWMVAFIFSYPFWVRTTFYTSGSSTYCSINTFDVDDSDDLPIDDYATVLKNTGNFHQKQLENLTTLLTENYVEKRFPGVSLA